MGAQLRPGTLWLGGGPGEPGWGTGGHVLQQGFGFARGVVGPEVLVLLHFLLQRQQLALQLAAQGWQGLPDVVGQLLWERGQGSDVSVVMRKGQASSAQHSLKRKLEPQENIQLASHLCMGHGEAAQGYPWGLCSTDQSGCPHYRVHATVCKDYAECHVC